MFRAKWRNTPVVIKFMGYEEDANTYNHGLFVHELRVWFPLSHPHVLKLFGACHEGKRFFVCEAAPNGELYTYVKANPATRCWQLMYEVALGLQYLHELGVVHNDLKGDNVLVGANGDAKIIDFGLSSILDVAEVAIDPKKGGAVRWQSPEVLRSDRQTLASDVYAFRMLIVELVGGEPPWGRWMTDSVVRESVASGKLPSQPVSMSDSQWNLVCLVCASEPSERVTILYVADKLLHISQQQQQEPEQEQGHGEHQEEQLHLSVEPDGEP